MLPIFLFIALPVLSVTLLLVILCRKLVGALTHPQVSHHVRRAMSRLEALRLLGLNDSAGVPAIRAAYKRLMIQYHPDHGGSTQRAAMINLARDTLLRKRRTRAA